MQHKMLFLLATLEQIIHNHSVNDDILADPIRNEAKCPDEKKEMTWKNQYCSPSDVEEAMLAEKSDVEGQGEGVEEVEWHEDCDWECELSML